MADPASGSDADKDIDQGDFGEDDTGNENLEIVGEEERIDEIKRNAETSGTCGENLTWSLVDGVLTISGTGEMESYDLNQNVTAPWYEDRDLVTNVIIEEGVTSIGGGAFYCCSGLTSVTIPEGVTSIREDAFFNCSGLTSVTIPEGVTSIGENAFLNCSGLTSITIPEGVTSIEGYAFSGCSGLTSVTIPEGVTLIEWYAFSGCSRLTSVTIPEGVTSIGGWTFSDCSGLMSVTIPEGVTFIGWCAFSGCNSLTNVYYNGNESDWSAISIEDGNTEFLYSVIHYNNGHISGVCGTPSVQDLTWTLIDGTLTISGTGDMASCGTGMFELSSAPWYESRAQIRHVDIEQGVTSIGDSAFGGCDNMASITTSNSVTNIESYAFRECSSLTNVIVPDSVTTIGYAAFSGCGSLTDITIPESVVNIGANTFENCGSLASIVFPAGVTSIGDYTLTGCTNLAEVVIPDSVTSIGNNAFFGCSSLTNVTIPDNVVSIGNNAFAHCTGLTSVTIPDSVTHMGDVAFSNCGLVEVRIPSNLTSIAGEMFYGCANLKSVAIPKAVTSIEVSAFYGCDGLTDVYYQGNESDWSGILIGEFNEPLLNAAIHYNSTQYDSPIDPADITINADGLGDAVLYVPYSGTIKLSQGAETYEPTFKVVTGTLPGGLWLDPASGEISGTPTESGSFPVTVEAALSVGEGENISIQGELTILVKENTDDNIFESCDEGYELEQPIGEKTDQGYVLREYSDQLFVSAGKFEQFVDLWFNGEKLIREEDYTAESGSTRITVRKQTFENKSKSGSNTISAEFRDEDGNLKRTSQNFTVETDKPDENPGTGNKPGIGGSGGVGGGSGTGGSGGSGGGSGTGGSGGSGGGSGSGGSGGSNSGSGSGSGGNSAMPYTNDSWVKDEIGWRCKKPDNTWLTNGWYLLPYNETTGWYYFNEEGYMATGWLKDQEKWYYLNPVSDGTLGVMVTGWRLIDGKWYYLNEQADGTEGTMAASGWRQIPWGESTAWYYFNQEGHMASGWIQDQGRRYYLNPASGQTQGAMMTGWQLIDEIWYYFNEQADGTYGALMTNTWIGNYYVDNNGMRV
jgi:hypothetical protein